MGQFTTLNWKSLSVVDNKTPSLYSLTQIPTTNWPTVGGVPVSTPKSGSIVKTTAGGGVEPIGSVALYGLTYVRGVYGPAVGAGVGEPVLPPLYGLHNS